MPGEAARPREGRRALHAVALLHQLVEIAAGALGCVGRESRAFSQFVEQRFRLELTLTARYGGIDILVHALAFAKREDLDGSFVDTSRDGFALAMDVSALSVFRSASPA